MDTCLMTRHVVQTDGRKDILFHKWYLGDWISKCGEKKIKELDPLPICNKNQFQVDLRPKMKGKAII